MKISVFGSGYVGLVSAACLADAGHSVLCVDVDVQKIEQLKQGIMPIYEPGLEDLVQRNVAQCRLQFGTDSQAAVKFGKLLFIAVGTPQDEDGSADLRYVLQVAQVIADHLDEYKLIINKSTVPVGTASKVQALIHTTLQRRGSTDAFDVCSNPEFLKEGAAIEDFTKAARIIVGTDSQRVISLMRECYAPYNRNRDKMMFMDVRSAELTKYAANAMLATKISFMNEMANIAQRLGADIEQVRQGIGSDPRIGYHFIYPGCGYGGTCLPKDVKALMHTANQAAYQAQLLQAVEAVNLRQKCWAFETLQAVFSGALSGKTIAVWGLAFKPNTDDMREASSRVLIEALWSVGARVRAYDPKATAEAIRLYGERADLELCATQEDAVAGADALVICTEWKQFRALDFDWLRDQLRSPVLVDGRNLYQPQELLAHGLRYFAVGRGESIHSS